MKYITLGVFILLSVVLTYQDSPQGVLRTVRSDLRERGIDPKVWDSHIMYFYSRPSFYGISLSMGAYAKSIHIGVNWVAWRSMTRRQKKALVAHELTHCIGVDQYHCYKRSCIMSGGDISKWNKVPYETMLDTLIKHHYEIKISDSYHTGRRRNRCGIHLDEVIVTNK